MFVLGTPELREQDLKTTEVDHGLHIALDAYLKPVQTTPDPAELPSSGVKSLPDDLGRGDYRPREVEAR